MLLRRLVIGLMALGSLVLAAEAGGRTILASDDAGRTIRFDVGVQAVDVEWYADVLRRATHGDEISQVTIRIVPRRVISRLCGAQAAACYAGRRSPRIVVPTGKGPATAYSLLHEYAHHLDSTIPHGGYPEPNGSPRWWRARGIGRLLRAGRVDHDYSHGWSRSIGEIFAEDYAQLHLAGRYGIPWLPPPGQRIRAALAADLGTIPDRPAEPGELGPLLITRSGTILPGERRTLPFGLLGPGRRVTFSARVAGANLPGARARIELICGDVVEGVDLVEGQERGGFDIPGLGPADCEVSLSSLSDTPLDFAIRLRLAVEG